MNHWDARFLALAEHVAQWSKDPSTKCGAAVVRGRNEVVSLGYNGPPSGVDDELAIADRDIKLAVTVHAEKNALLKARDDVRGCTIYVWPMPPCAQCAAAIIQAGIRRVVAPRATCEQYERWGKDWELAEMMYKHSGVQLDIDEGEQT